MRHRTPIIGLLIATALLVSCAGGEQATAGAAASMPACAPSEAAISSPPALPATLPLPPGTVLNLVHESSAGATIIFGVIPLSLSDAAGFFVDQIPRAGFELGPGDAEQDEAEAVFSGPGVDGQWKVHSILDCADAVTLNLAIIRR